MNWNIDDFIIFRHNLYKILDVSENYLLTIWIGYWVGNNFPMEFRKFPEQYKEFHTFDLKNDYFEKASDELLSRIVVQRMDILK